VRVTIFGNSYFTLSLYSDQQPPLLDGLAPIYDYLYRRLKEYFTLSIDNILGSLAAASTSHLVCDEPRRTRPGHMISYALASTPGALQAPRRHQ
jgi:hypothetical protein